MVDGTCLENKRGATHREFESRPLRQMCYNREAICDFPMRSTPKAILSIEEEGLPKVTVFKLVLETKT